MSSVSSDFIVDLRRLQLLRELADRGTVTATASALHLTPSAVSQQLAALSKEAGVPVLVKVGRRVRLTAEGQILLQHADRLHEQLERTRADLLRSRGGLTGQVTVGAFGSAIPALVAPAISDLARSRPGLSVTVRETEAPQCYTDLRMGEVDVVITVAGRHAPPKTDRRYERRHLLDERLDLLLPSDHPEATHQTIDLARLSGTEWIMGNGGPCHEIALAACQAAGFTPDVRHRTSDWNALAALVAVGLGVALVPRMALPQIPPGAVLRPVRQPSAKRGLVLVVRQGSSQSPLIDSMTNALTAAAAELTDQRRPRRASTRRDRS